MMDWSEMLPEVVDIIAQKYITSYEDYPSFAGVCKSWRLAAAGTYRNSNGPPSRLPSLIFTEKSDDHESRELFLLSNKSIRKIRIPEAYGKLCRSSCGWLLTVGEDFSSQLINPLSREIINLPKANTFPEAIHSLLPLDWDVAIAKVVLLMESKLVFVLCGYTGQLGFCHIGDSKWKCVEQPLNDPLFDITFYNGQIYGFNLFKIQAYNVNGKDPTILVDVATIPEEYDEHEFSAYIVGLDDGDRKQLLVIMRYSEEFVEEYIGEVLVKMCEKTQSFQVLAYDLDSGNWSKVKDFGTKTLFVGFTSSFWVEDTTGVIKSNCIYFTNFTGKDMGIYHLLDETIEPYYFAGESISCDTPPMWLQSV